MKQKLSLLLVLMLLLTSVVACQQAATKDTKSNETTTTNEQATKEAIAPVEQTVAEPTESTSEHAASTLEDGFYYAEQEEFADNGWKETVLLEVKDSTIVNADWNAISNKFGYDKKTAVQLGQYPMVEQGKAQAEWDVQAKKVEDYLVEVQDPTKIAYSDEEGHTDTISGVSIHVNGFFELAEKALAAGPQEKGPFTDGSYHAEADEFSESGWKDFVDVTVINGHIVSVRWNGINKDDPKLDKLTAVAEGKYPMVEQGKAQAEWNVQAKAVEDYLIETQDLGSIQYSDDEGHTDVISGVSIHVKPFFELVKKALGM